TGGGMLAILTLVFMDVTLSVLTLRFKFLDRLMNGVSMFILENGKLYLDRMKKSRIQIEDILEAARKTHGLESLDEIKSAILEKDGSISIIPKYKDKVAFKT